MALQDLLGKFKEGPKILKEDRSSSLCVYNYNYIIQL
jgi:hypothetical protein